MPRIDPFKSWRIRITAVDKHRWEYEEDGEWEVFASPSGDAIHLDQDSTGYVFYDEEWAAHSGTGPTVPELSIKAQNAAVPNPFGAGTSPSFDPDTTYASSGVQAFRWNIVGPGSAYADGFPQTTEDKAWAFSVISGDVKVDPEMVILRPDPPPPQ